MNGRYHGKRFLSLLVVVLALIIGFFWGPAAQFGSYSTALGAVYGAYLAGQSATDWQKAKNGVPA
jgi:hypothetical protein